MDVGVEGKAEWQVQGWRGWMVEGDWEGEVGVEVERWGKGRGERLVEGNVEV